MDRTLFIFLLITGTAAMPPSPQTTQPQTQTNLLDLLAMAQNSNPQPPPPPPPSPSPPATPPATATVDQTGNQMPVIPVSPGSNPGTQYTRINPFGPTSSGPQTNTQILQYTDPSSQVAAQTNTNTGSTQQQVQTVQPATTGTTQMNNQATQQVSGGNQAKPQQTSSPNPGYQTLSQILPPHMQPQQRTPTTNNFTPQQRNPMFQQMNNMAFLPTPVMRNFQNPQLNTWKNMVNNAPMPQNNQYQKNPFALPPPNFPQWGQPQYPWMNPIRPIHNPWGGPNQQMPGMNPVGPRPGMNQMGPMNGMNQVGPMPGMNHMRPMPGMNHMGHMPGMNQMGPMPGMNQMGPIPGMNQMGPVPGMNQMGPIPGMNQMGPMSGMNQMGPMSGMNQMGPMPGMNQIGSMNGIPQTNSMPNRNSGRGQNQGLPSGAAKPYSSGGQSNMFNTIMMMQALTGEPLEGPMGGRGRGMMGIPGMSGLTGMSGIPGMSSLGMSGIPGMSSLGMSGIPGMSSLPGMSSIPGLSSLPGMNSIPGMNAIPGVGAAGGEGLGAALALMQLGPDLGMGTSSMGGNTGFGASSTGFGSASTGFGSASTGFGSASTGFGSTTTPSSTLGFGGQMSPRGRNPMQELMSNPTALMMMNIMGIDLPDPPPAGRGGVGAGGFSMFGGSQTTPQNSWTMKTTFDPIASPTAAGTGTDLFSFGATGGGGAGGGASSFFV